jgi:antitoxin MazE
MKTRIVETGGSYVSLIPREIAEAIEPGEEVELVAEPGRIILRTSYQPRAGWDAAFRALADHEDDCQLNP